ncbi:hypothetical protein ACQ4M4_11750 [Leptolyngbya sp. AN02str]|uniref:hypothetical protein n=1 Tax=Leptolyngbya sp. AN02str TaxID=3423363 RepID=UPI003D321BC2
MNTRPELVQSSDIASQNELASNSISILIPRPSIWRRLRGGLLLGVGYMLSPLSWWNDLFFNLPVAYVFGFVVSLIAPDLFLPTAIAGYWFSNLAGILLMQFGFMDVAQVGSNQRNLKKELLIGILSSSIYTGLILVLMHVGILEAPALNFDEGFSLHALLPKLNF